MAFIVEDNSGLSNATSFVDVAYADGYFADRAVSEWAAFSTSTKQSLLIQGTDYIEAVYSESFIGTKYTDTQALSYPRLVDSEKVDVPDRLKKAVCELALKANSQTLLQDTDKQTIEETVGSITVKYGQYASQLTQYNAVYNLLKPYLSGYGGATRQAVRA